jgi:hypothetical protein
MPVIRAMVCIPKTSGIPRDAVTNTLYFNGIDTTSTTLAAIAGGLDGAYLNMRGYLSNKLNLALAVYKFYDMSQPEPRPPLAQTPMVLSGGTASTSSLPPELAIVVSFKGAPFAGVPPSRQRGRVYLGPLGHLGVIDTAGYPENMAATVQSAAVGFGDSLLSASDASPNYTWVVRSTVGATPGVWPVVAGWVDNAFDIQRRRGVTSTVRQTFS